MVPPTGLQISKPWLPAIIRSSRPMSSCTTRRSRPLTTHTGHRSASCRTALRMGWEITASSRRPAPGAPRASGGLLVGLGDSLASELLLHGDVVVYSSIEEVLDASLLYRVAL